MAAESGEPADEQLDVLVEQRAERERSKRAQRAAGAEPEQETPHCQPERAGERRSDVREARYELRHEKRRCPVALEKRLGLAHAGVGRKRDPARELQHAVAVSPPGPQPWQAAEPRRDDGKRYGLSSV